MAGTLFAAITVFSTGCGHAAFVQPSSLTLTARGTDYYQSVQGKTGAELLSALTQLIAKHKDLGYDQARDVMFAEVDDYQNQDTIECVYTGRRGTGIHDRSTAYSRHYNTEHTWPQSKGAEGVAKSDLHHLFPVDNDENSRRSSLPFGEVKSFADSPSGMDRSGEGVDSRGHKVYEPRNAHKGNVARALLYFYTCYHNTGKIDLSNFRQEKEVLLRWSEQDPVDTAELQRNETIYRIQGNRNPFIDHPEYVKQIGDFPS